MSCYDLIPVKGTRFFIGDKTTNGTVLAYTEVGMVESFSEFGPDADVSSVSLLGSDATVKSMGATDNGEIALTIAKTSTDTGMQELIATNKANTVLAYKLAFSDNADDDFVFNGLCRMARVTIGNGDDVSKIRCAIAITGAISSVFGGEVGELISVLITKALLFGVTGAPEEGATASKALLFGVTGAPEEGATAAKATLFLIVDTTP